MFLFGRKIPAPIAYAMGTFFDKFFSIVTIPLMANAMSPAMYGQYDVVLALCAALLAIMGLGLGDTLVRFATIDPNDEKQRRTAAELLGAAIMLVFAGGIVTQLCAPWFIKSLNLSISLTALRWTLLSTVVSGLIEFTLMWLRLKDRAGLFSGIVFARTIVAVVVTWSALLLGWGADGVLIVNAIAGLALCAGLLAYQIKATGVGLSREAFRRIAVYGMPLVGAGLTTFAMGGLNRFFLPSAASYDDIGAFSLAGRLSQAIFPFTAPFILWWGPKRIAVLLEPHGAKRNADMWGVGVSIMILSCIALALMGPLFIGYILPPAYAPAMSYLPATLALTALMQLPTITSAGVYARDTTIMALGIDVAAAVAAVLGFFLLIPNWGIAGSIAALLTAYSVRVVLYVYVGNKYHPIPYSFGAAAIATAFGIALVWLAPPPSYALGRLIWSVLAGAALGSMILYLKLVKLPDTFLATLFGTLRQGPR